MNEFYQKYKETFKKYEKSDKGKARQRKYHNSPKGRKMLNKAKRKYNAKLKKQVFEILGNKCVYCGCIDIRCLQIDHIQGNGAKDRAKGNISTTLFLKIIRNPEKSKREYQILCANCNWIKRAENGENKGKIPAPIIKLPVFVDQNMRTFL